MSFMTNADMVAPVEVMVPAHALGPQNMEADFVRVRKFPAAEGRRQTKQFIDAFNHVRRNVH